MVCKYVTALKCVILLRLILLMFIDLIFAEAILGIPTDTKSAFKEIESSPFRQ